jgi:MscS family membrane protein
VRLEPSRGDLPPRTDLVVNVTVDIPGSTRPITAEVVADFAVVDRLSGASFDRQVVLTVQVAWEPRFLGVFAAPLGEPFNHGWGLFALELAFWGLLAGAAAYASGWIVRRVAHRAHPDTQGQVKERTQWPLAVFLVSVGLNWSWRLVDLDRLGFVRSLSQLVAVALAGFLVYRLSQAALLVYSDRRRRTHWGRANEVVAPILSKVMAVVLVVFVAVQALRIVGVDVSVLLAGGVVVGLVLSFAAQDTLSNLFSGLFILADQPFREGDEIRLATGDVCRVDRIGLRSTRLFHFRHEQVMIVPNNSLASERVTNLSYPDSTYRLVVEVGVGYSTRLRETLELIRKTAASVPDVLSGPGRAPAVWLREFTENGIRLEVRVYIPSSRHRNPVRTALMLAIKESLDAQGIVLPVQQHEVHLVNPPPPPGAAANEA